MNQPLHLTAMMYHYVRDPGDAAEAGSGIPGMSVKDFESQLDALAEEHTFVTWLDVRMALQQGAPLPDSACLLTFDDGVCDHYINVYPILRRRNLSGLFFIMDRSSTDGLVLGHKIHFLLAKLGPPGLREAIWGQLDTSLREQFMQAEKHYEVTYPQTSTDGQTNLLKAILQRDLSIKVDPLLSNLFETYIGAEQEIAQAYYLTPAQILEMAEGGMHFGGHSRSHPWFDWIDGDTRAQEIQDSAAWLQQFEPAPWAFAYPYGGLAADSPSLLKSSGFIAAFTTQAQRHHSDPYFIGRLDGEEMVQDGTSYA